MTERTAPSDSPSSVVGTTFPRLIELIPAAVYTCEAPSGRITFFNARAVELWGRSPRIGDSDEQFCGSFRLWRPDGSPLPHAETPMAIAVREGQPVRDEQVIIERPGGSRIKVLVNIDPIVDDAGRVIGAVNVFQDTTALEQVDEARSRLAAIIESSEDAIISKDLDGVITSWNQAAERLFGYTAAEAIGQPVTMLMSPDRYDEEAGILARVRGGDRISHYETVRRRKDGAELHISLTVSPVRDAGGRVIGASKIARDITERKHAERLREELLLAAERAREEAEAANRAKDEFLAMLGHELRNPLSAIRNAVTAAVLDESSRSRALSIATRQADQLSRIVDDLLDVARISRGSVILRKERVALSDVLQRAVDGARGLMEERGHTLTLTMPEQDLEVEADATRLEQAVANLLANAAKYTDLGGTVSVLAQREGDDAVIRVRDNGMGIPEAMLPRVFDLFVQGHRALDRAQGGLGIGLTLVRRIVELHGGRVEATSPGLGGGAEFSIRIKAVSVAYTQVGSIPPQQRKPSQSHPARVLMVEDNRDAADSLVMILELLGHHVRVVHDGSAALGAARANVPDIMLVDIGLPGMNGYEIAQAIRRDPDLKHVLLVALTGYGRSEDKARAMAAGFDYHLVKPVDLEALGELVGRLAPQVSRDAAQRGAQTLQ